ncbi:acyl-CoA dehydrogenase family protein [Gordonia soli]|uniref:Putative FMNH2-dependent monooxygenase n=1 Tax=Gordonia soli NBRC 108243 TaxID=1223545 RepID=M0QE77_9ACTN|nr:acyl-CoA dehydrogenase family protein [Gordonia soli]GAC66641.1 putative FMNH2-dependent monooxygenase [Gordonia soli NBRC 108243]
MTTNTIDQAAPAAPTAHRPDIEATLASWEGPVPSTREGWITRAAEAAALVGTTSLARDTEAANPVQEVEWIRRAGLIGLQGPVEHGGGNADWATVLDVVAEFAKVEGSIANILGWHYAYFWLFRSFGTPEQRERWEREVTVNRQLLAGIANFRDDAIAATDEGDHLILHGGKQFNTGLPVSDRVVIGVAIDGGDVFFVLADTQQSGIIYGDDWDTLGQRSTGSGSARIEGVEVAWTEAIGFADKQFQPQNANLTPGLTSQTLMPTFYVSLARGALDRAVEYVTENSRSWLHSEYERAIDEPHVLDGFGGLQSHLLAAEALLREASAKVSAALDDPNSITPERRAELAALLSAVKTVAVETGIEVTTTIFELVGARATARRYELDRFWRDLRTQSLHDPVAYKRRQVGAYLLRGDQPLAVDWYS